MRWRIPHIRLPAILRRQSFEQDLAEELDTHIELQTRKHIAQGLGPREARRRACIEFGGMEHAREECRRIDGWRWMDAVIRNGRQCFRSLAKNPGFTFVAILILSVSIGANVAVFTTIDALFLRPLPVHDPNRLVEVFSVDKQGNLTGLFSHGLDQLQNRAFAGVCGVATHYEAIEVNNDLRTLGVAAFSGGCFQTLRLPVQLGRELTPKDDAIGAERVAVITDSLWQSQFGGRPDVLGLLIRIGTEEFTIVGVTAKPFTGLLLAFPEPVMVPLLQQPDFTPDGSRPATYYVNVLARLATGISDSQALASIVARRQIILEQTVPHHFTGIRRNEYLARSLTLAPAKSGFDYFLRRRLAQPLCAIFGVCGVMLLIACINLSSLLLARGLQRQREVGIRLALGAARSHIVWLLVLENVVLVLTGAVLGITIGLGIVRVILARGNQIFGNFDLHVGFDIRVLAFVLAAVAFVIAAFLAASLWQSSYLAKAGTLKQSGRGVTAPSTSAQKLLLSVQVALTFALIAGSALFATSVNNMYRIDFGIQPENVWIARLSPRPGGYRTPAYWKTNALPYYRSLLTQFEGLPGIASATFTDNVPFFNNGWGADLTLLEGGRIERTLPVRVIGVADGYFATLGTKIVSGQDFRRENATADEPGVILSESLAHHLAGGTALLNQHVRIGTDSDLQRLKIVGIASDMDLNLADLNDTKPFVAFVDFWQHQNLQGYPAVLIKTRASTLNAAAVRRIVEQNGHEYVESFSAVTKEIDNALIENRVLAWLSGSFAVLALLIAAVGLFGLLSYQVTNRTAEIGIRVALGAQPPQIRSLILAQVGRLLLIGMSAGIVLTFAVRKLLAGLLYGITISNPMILPGAIVLLLSAAFIAAMIPTRRALKINPIEALRHE